MARTKAGTPTQPQMAVEFLTEAGGDWVMASDLAEKIGVQSDRLSSIISRARDAGAKVERDSHDGVSVYRLVQPRRRKAAVNGAPRRRRTAPASTASTLRPPAPGTQLQVVFDGLDEAGTGFILMLSDGREVHTIRVTPAEYRPDAYGGQLTVHHRRPGDDGATRVGLLNGTGPVFELSFPTPSN